MDNTESSTKDAGLNISPDGDKNLTLSNENIAAVPSLESRELQRLRALLFQNEISTLEELKRRLDNQEIYTKDISNVIAEAILLRTQKDDGAIQSVLQPTVDNIFQNSLRRHPLDVANQLFPIIGPAIRRSIAETFRSMLQSFNTTLEMSFSWKGLKWRWEALRTGKSFSDIVLLHTLIYRVEQVFLIHTETGIVLDHVVNDGVKTQDADLISGMLTAIQDFVRDAFASGEQSSLESLQMGELNIIVERSPKIYLACVVRGTPPAALSRQLNSSLDLIGLDCVDDLDHFNGDTEPFQKARRYLEDCLTARYLEEDKRLPWYIKILPVALLLILLGGYGYLKYQEYKYEDIVQLLGRQPGIVLTQLHPKLLGTWQIQCLRDAMSVDPEKFLVNNGMPASRFEMMAYPYISLDDGIVQARVAQAISLPSEVNMRLDENHVLHFTGCAPMGWIIATREKALATPGVIDVDTSQLKDPRTQELNSLMQKVDGTLILFPVNKDAPVGEDQAKLVAAVDNIIVLEKLANQMGMGVTITIYGHTDATGNAKYNYELSQERAKTVAALLYARGSSVPISTYGMGADFAARHGEQAVADQASRKILIKVHLVRLGTVDDSYPRS